MRSKGRQVFDKIFGEKAAEFAKVLESRSYGMTEQAIYFPYEQFYSNDDKLALQTRMLVAIASLVSQGSFVDLEYYVTGAINVGCTPVQVSETILQMGVYVGEPKAHEAMEVYRRATKVDIGAAYKEASTTGPDHLQSGDKIFRRLFGDDKAEDVYQFLKELAPSLDTFAIEQPFGQYYAKEHLLDLRTRELITIASLVTTGMLPQLELHIGAALYIGCTIVQIEQVILQMSVFAGNPKMLNALKMFKPIKDKVQRENQQESNKSALDV